MALKDAFRKLCPWRPKTSLRAYSPNGKLALRLHLKPHQIKISYNCAPMLNTIVICHLIQGKDQGCCQQGGFRWGVRKSEFTIFRIKSLLDKSLTREKIKNKSNKIIQRSKQAETEGFKRSYIVYASLVFKNPGMCIE